MIDYTPKELMHDISNFLKRDMINTREAWDYVNRINKHWWDTQESDFSIYSEPEYLYEMYICYMIGSRPLIKRSYPVLKDKKIDSILDYGAGCGASTLLLSKLFPNSKIIYQNIESVQYDFARSLLKNQKNILFIHELSEIQEADLIYSLELLEHIKEPIKLLYEFISLDPKYLVVQSEFNIDSYGHFSKFLVGETLVDRKKIGRIVHRAIRDSGFHQEEKSKSFWNCVPRIWEKNEVT